MNDTAQELNAKIESRQATVGILGLGYVGLPLALAFSKAGFPVLGFDVDDSKVELLNRGESYIKHIEAEAVSEAAGREHFSATSDFSRLGEPDVLVICVPTPLTSQREPDMTYVVSTAEAIAKALRPGQLVALESTTYPGTTEELLRELLETSGLTCCEDFFLAYSPEREDPGNPDFATTTIPKVVGGVDDTSTDLAVALYSPVVVETVRVSSARTAEAAKLLENIFRAVNIALVNELKIVYDAMDIDIWEVLDAAAIVVGSPTLNNQLFPTVSDFLVYMKGLKPLNKIGAAFGSYGWSGEAVKLINKELEAMKFEVIDPGIRIQYIPEKKGLEACFELGKKVGQSINEKI